MFILYVRMISMYAVCLYLCIWIFIIEIVRLKGFELLNVS